MNVMRFAILGVAFIAAAAAVLLARGMLGGGTPSSQAAPPPALTAEVLVAAKDIAPGHSLDAALVRWEAWPKSAVAPGFITQDKQSDIAKAVAGIVVRAPLVAGQPIGEASIVRAGAAGFLAATIKPGMRAIGVPVNAETSAGGFILPNDRVDVVLTRDMSGGGSGIKNFQSETILRDVRVLAVDQTAQQPKDQQSVVGKTATLELMPEQAELLARSEQMGVLSLALRALGDSSGEPLGEAAKKPAPVLARVIPAAAKPKDETVIVFRYGVRRDPEKHDSDAGANPAPVAEPAPQAAPASAPAAPSGAAGAAGAAATEGIANPIGVKVVPSPMAAMKPQ